MDYRDVAHHKHMCHLKASEAVVLNAKGRVNHFRNVVLKHPLERREEVGVNSLNVDKVDGLVEQHLVEGHGKPSVNVMSVEHGQALDKVKMRYSQDNLLS